MAQAYDSLATQAHPIGAVAPFAGSSSAVPAGWLLCDGSAVSRATFSALFTAVGVGWGIGDGTTTFNLPDCRGRFMRGVDRGAGNDPDINLRVSSNGGNGGDNVGSYQDHQYRQHQHTVQTSDTSSGVAGSQIAGNSAFAVNHFTDADYAPLPLGPGGNETRPINANVHFIIRFN